MPGISILGWKTSPLPEQEELEPEELPASQQLLHRFLFLVHNLKRGLASSSSSSSSSELWMSGIQTSSPCSSRASRSGLYTGKPAQVDSGGLLGS